jgi:hypothetical protein
MMPASLQSEGRDGLSAFRVALISGIARSIPRLAYCQPANLQFTDDGLVDPATAQMERADRQPPDATAPKATPRSVTPRRAGDIVRCDCRAGRFGFNIAIFRPGLDPL